MRFDIEHIRSCVNDYYTLNKRAMPWRDNTSPYYVAVSEIMLQQTQVASVIPKFERFVTVFPDWHVLANATTQELLQEWSGLGYNTRALRLRETAFIIVTVFGGFLPDTIEELDALPGIGYATACAILTYVYNIPTIFVETNIRRVVLHHGIREQGDPDKIPDSLIMDVVEQLADSDNPREWYWALMDYGAYLKKVLPANPNKQSVKYTKQSKFEGSLRQMRGAILRQLVSNQSLTELEQDPRFWDALRGLKKDKIITEDNGGNTTLV